MGSRFLQSEPGLLLHQIASFTSNAVSRFVRDAVTFAPKLCAMFGSVAGRARGPLSTGKSTGRDAPTNPQPVSTTQTDQDGAAISSAFLAPPLAPQPAPKARPRRTLRARFRSRFFARIFRPR